MISRIIDFLRLGRPIFLLGPVILYGLGAAIAYYVTGSIDWQAYALGQIGVTAIQWMTHYANDYFDLESDRSNPSRTAWSGGSGVLVEGKISPRVALSAALVLMAVAVTDMAAIALILRPGPLALPIMLTALALAWFYSAPPLRLVSSGFGEVIVALVVAGLTPVLAYYLQTDELSLLLVDAVLPLLALQMCVLLAVAFPDVESDVATGKRTLVARVGGGRAANLYIILILVGYSWLISNVWPGWAGSTLPPPVIMAALFPAPLALWQMWRTVAGAWREPTHWSRFTFWTIALFAGTAGSEMLAFAWLAYTRG